MNPRQRDSHLPGWLWFFLILPGLLFVLLLWRRRGQRAGLREIFSFHFEDESEPARYSEPDSIPIETRGTAVDDLGGAGDAEPASAAEAPPPAAPVINTTPTVPGQEDDLKVIEGIGPAISAILRGNGIFTFAALADTPTGQLEAILERARLSHLADPATWPEQARLAADGRWDDLEALQNTLKAGRRRK